MNSALCTDGTIALICNPLYQALREKISGVYSAATRYGWQVFQVEASPTIATIARIKKILNPIGFIIDPLQLPFAITKKPFNGTPVVLLSRDGNRRSQIFDCTCQDNQQPVLAAINTLTERSNLACLAYIGHPSKALWSSFRGDLFRKYAACRYPHFEYLGPDPSSNRGSIQLINWLQMLPKPAGLFLATDHLAPSVFNAIHRSNIIIPDEISVISVDDIHQICLNVTPNLSSINMNFFKSGEIAVELLKQRLSHPTRPIEMRTYGINFVSKRSSTRKPYTDKRVTKAVDYIANNITSKISSLQVIKAMGCSRRQGEQIFRRFTGTSILQAIQANRIEKAMSLLKGSDIPIDEIPSFCGYDSLAFFKIIFRRKTGLTMREWRKRQTGITKG